MLNIASDLKLSGNLELAFVQENPLHKGVNLIMRLNGELIGYSFTIQETFYSSVGTRPDFDTTRPFVNSMGREQVLSASHFEGMKTGVRILNEKEETEHEAIVAKKKRQREEFEEENKKRRRESERREYERLKREFEGK